MKSFYNLVMLALLAVTVPAVSVAQNGSSLHLDAQKVRMSDLQKMEQTYMAPIQSIIKGSVASSGLAIDAEPQQDEQNIGVGVVYGAEIERLGLQLSYFYFITAALAIGGDLTFFLPESVSFGGIKTTASFYTLNVVAHYMLYTSIIMRAYVLGGLNYAIFRFKTKGNGFNESSSSSEIGLNIGGGIEYALAVGFLFAELKYILGDADQLVIAAGYRHRLGR